MKHLRRLLMVGVELLVAASFSLYAATTDPVTINLPASSNSSPPQVELTQLATHFDAAQILKGDIRMSESRTLTPVTLNETGFQNENFTFVEKSDVKDLKAIGKAAKSDMEAPVRLKAAPKTAINLKSGYVLGKDYVHGGSEINCIMEYVLDQTDPNMIHIHDFYGLGYTVDAIVNTELGTVSILPQLVYESTTYGAGYMFPITFETDGIIYYPSSPVTGIIDDKGVIYLGSWGIVIADGGNYNGTLMAAIDESEYVPCNGSIKATKVADGSSSVIEFPVLVEQSDPASIKIYNFGTTAVPVTARLSANGQVSVSPQFIYNYGLFGDFYCNAVNTTTGTISQTDPILGTLSNNKIKFGAWCANSVMSPGSIILYLYTSELSTDLTIEKPEGVSFNLEGKGTAASPYLVKTAADLLAISAASKNDSFSGLYFKQTSDIDMSGVTSFEPIGPSNATFNGIYDGDNRSIKNLTIDAVGYSFQGLFGSIYEDAVLKNIVLSNFKMTGTGYYLGGIAGYSLGNIINCHVEGNIDTQAAYVGGIVGRTYGPIADSNFTGTISAIGYVGGIVGYSYSEILRCNSDADVTLPVRISNGAACVGGIAGLSQSYSILREGKIHDCYFSGTVTQGSGYGFAGGIAGYCYANEVANCLNTGLIRTTSPQGGDDEIAGGIAGIVRDMVMTDCLNSGLISIAGSSQSGGGLAGYLNGMYAGGEGLIEFTYIKNSYNNGQISSTNVTDHAGIYGYEFIMPEFDKKPSDFAFTNVYSDNQATGLDDNEFGHPTSFFVGSIPQGLSNEYWTVNNGFYTTLKTFSGTTVDKLAQALILFGDKQSTRVMKRNTSVAAPNGVRWSLDNNGVLTDVTESLRLFGTTLSMTGVYGNDQVVATVNGQATGRRYDINVVPTLFKGEGTEENPYLIENVADFIKLHNGVMHYDHKGDYFKQTADVDFEFSDDFSGIGAGNHTLAFAGVFDGDNHTISGLKINAYVTDGNNIAEGTYNYGGLFHIGAPTSVIRNVIINPDCEFSMYNYAGAIIGYTQGSVENCRNYAAVEGRSYIGGITGYMTETASMANCYNAGAVTDAGRYTGGIAAYNLGAIENCQNDGVVTSSDNFAGGIAGASAGTIKTIVNSANITGKEYVGGILGSNAATTGQGNLVNSFSSGMITSLTSNYVGGVLGYSNGRGNIEGNFFDASINPALTGCSSLSDGFYGLSTSEFLSEKAPEGFIAEDFTFSANAYPALKAFAEEEASIANTSMFIRFSKGEKISNMSGSTGLSSDSNVVWALASAEEPNDYFTLGSNTINVTVPTGEIVATDILKATYDGKYTKVYDLKSIPVIFEGSGSVEDPFQLKTPEDLNKLANFMINANMDYDGYVFQVMNDIEYTEEESFTPIGFNLTGEAVGSLAANAAVPFNGYLDGNNKTISGISHENTNTTASKGAIGKNYGFIGTVGAKGTITDLTLEGSLNLNSYVGGFAGLLYGTITNCESRMNIDATAISNTYAGGFTSHMYDGSRIENCVFTGGILRNYAAAATNAAYAAGIAALTDEGSNIINCINKGQIGNLVDPAEGAAAGTGAQYVGGIAGQHGGSIDNCSNEGEIYGKSYMGGIAGRVAKNGQVYNSFNIADIEVPGTNYVGGITGATAGSGTAYIVNCYNTANITVRGGYGGGIIGNLTNGTTVDNCYNTGDIRGYYNLGYCVGGVIGQANASAAYPTLITNCWNSGDIYNVTQSTGGLAGKTNSATITDCYNTGNVTVENEYASASGVGGLIGSACGTIERSWNSGTVWSSCPSTGGLIGTGAMPIAKVNECANFGDVTCTTDNEVKGYATGGIWGGYGPCDITNSYNYGTITGDKVVGGIIGLMWSNTNGGSSISNCYNEGLVVSAYKPETPEDGAGEGDEPTDEPTIIISNIASICSAADAALMEVSNAYYDTDVCEVFENDDLGIGLTREELMNADLGDVFIYRTACLPTIPVMDEVPFACLKAAFILFSDNETAENVTLPVFYGMMPHVIWTASDNFELDGEGIATPIESGEAWLRAVTDEAESDLSKVFNMILEVIPEDNSVENIFGTKEIQAIEYYTLDGFKVNTASQGNLYVVKVKYTDGTIKVAKIRF